LLKIIHNLNSVNNDLVELLNNDYKSKFYTIDIDIDLLRAHQSNIPNYIENMQSIITSNQELLSIYNSQLKQKVNNTKEHNLMFEEQKALEMKMKGETDQLMYNFRSYIDAFVNI